MFINIMRIFPDDKYADVVLDAHDDGRFFFVLV